MNTNTDRKNYIPQCGDIVKLKEPYKPEETISEIYAETFQATRNIATARQAEIDWQGFTHGIIVEITSYGFNLNGNEYGNNQMPRNVSLHLFDQRGRLLMGPSGLHIPGYVDFHRSELELHKIAADTGYITVQDPPDWNRLWEEEKSILNEFLPPEQAL